VIHGVRRYLLWPVAARIGLTQVFSLLEQAAEPLPADIRERVRINVNRVDHLGATGREYQNFGVSPRMLESNHPSVAAPFDQEPVISPSRWPEWRRPEAVRGVPDGIEVGAVVPVLYDPQDPNRARIATLGWPVIDTLLPLLGVVVSAVLPVGMLRVWLRGRRARGQPGC
jgi:hypothetical protein